MRESLFVWLAVSLLTLYLGCAAKHSQDQFDQFLQAHVAKVEPLSAQTNLVYWEAPTMGKAEKFEELKQLQLQIRRIYSDANDFARIKAFDESKSVREPCRAIVASDHAGSCPVLSDRGNAGQHGRSPGVSGQSERTD